VNLRRGGREEGEKRKGKNERKGVKRSDIYLQTP
jgi:hypothetical protein